MSMHSELSAVLLSDGYRYRMEIRTPKQWYMREVNRSILFTKHGLSLEKIVLERVKWKSELSNGFTFPKAVLLHEIPEIVLGELCANSNAYNMEILSNEIRTIDGLACSATEFSYTAINSLRMNGLMYCIPFKNYITVLWYCAESTHYYYKSCNDFTNMVSTIKLMKRRYLLLPGISRSAHEK